MREIDPFVKALVEFIIGTSSTTKKVRKRKLWFLNAKQK